MEDGGVLCRCNHLTDFIVVETPSSWQDVADSIMLGFVVNTFTWAQAMECLSHPEWSFVHVVTISLVVFNLVGLLYAVRRDRHELHLVEALMAG